MILCFCSQLKTQVLSTVQLQAAAVQNIVSLTRGDRKALEALLAIFTATRWQSDQTKPTARWLQTMESINAADLLVGSEHVTG